MAAAQRALSVGALTRRIHDELASFGPVLVAGELSQGRVHPSGHFYGTLADHDAVLSLVMWRSTVVRHGPLPAAGSLIEVRGSLSVYAPRGQYQLVASRMQPLGAGDLAARLEALRAKLTAEGLCDEARKRPLPLLPRAVGLATAAGSAALADMLDSLRARFPAMHIVHAPCLVQGAGAAASIIAALQRLSQHPAVDLIIVGRGGGSLEDLWAFNEEALLRAIAACPVPVISAVGHETDSTLADLVADRRAKTPTAAAELAVPVAAELHNALAEQRGRLDLAISARLSRARRQLEALASHRALAGPGWRLGMRQRQLDELRLRLDAALERRLAAARGRLDTALPALRLLDPSRRLRKSYEQLQDSEARLHRLGSAGLRTAQQRWGNLTARLEALSPLAVIGRGYSVLRRASDGQVVRLLAEAPPGELLRARLSDGWLETRVEAAQPARLGEASAGYLA